VERDSASERREIPVTQSDLISDLLPFGRRGGQGLKRFADQSASAGSVTNKTALACYPVEPSLVALDNLVSLGAESPHRDSLIRRLSGSASMA
jgi:hypothetical protein